MNDTEMNFSTMTADQKAALLSMLLESEDLQKELEAKKELRKAQMKKEIERKVKELESKVKSEKELQEQSKKRQKELETEIEKVKGGISGKTYGVFVNPSNPSEVYKTGEYTTWMKELAKSDGINIHDKTEMREWVKSKKSQ